MNKKIVIKGAKEHNLKNISVEIPKDKFIVIKNKTNDPVVSAAPHPNFDYEKKEFIK